jgi:ABC-2 type transport system permease protein
MSTLWTLIHADFKSHFGLAILWRRIFREKKDRWLIPIFGFSLLGALPLLFAIVVSIREAYRLLKPLGMETALLDMGIAMGQAMILLFGIYYVIGALYFSRDMEMLIPLPLKPSDVMISKFAVIVVSEYLTTAIIVLPFIITYGILAHSEAGYWVNAALVYLVMPITPLAIVSVPVVAMMRVINISRKKDLLIILGSIVMLATVLSFQFLIQRATTQNLRTQDVVALLSSPGSALVRIRTWFPPGIWAAKAIAGGFSRTGLIYLGIVLGSSFSVFGALTMLSERFFYGGVVGLNEIAMRKRRLTRNEIVRQISSGRHAVTAIFVREWRIMNRTPVFLLNGVIMGILFPLMLLFFLRSGAIPFTEIPASGMTAPSVLIAALYMTICSCINGVSASAFSREGVQFWISKAIPVAPREQVAAKFLHSYLMGTVGIIAALIVIIIRIHPKAADLMAALGLALVASALLTAAGMIIDLARPMFDWTNPQKAMKQNFNVLLALLADIAILTFAFLSAIVLLIAPLADAAVIGILFLEIAFLAALGYWALLKFAEKRYREIEL